MNIRNIIRENIKNVFLDKNLINEDLKFAQKILKDFDISQDNEAFIYIKDKLSKENAIGYLGPVVKLALKRLNIPDPKYGNDRSFSAFKYSYDFCYDYIKDNKELIKNLPKPLIKYDSLNELDNELYNLKNIKTIKKLTDKLTNKHIVELIFDDFSKNEISSELLSEIEYFIQIPSSDQKEFLTKTDKYKDLNTFFKAFSTFCTDHKEGFSYSKVLNMIKGMSENEIVLLYNENNMILARILTYSASQKIGSKSWCIVGSESHFDQYTEYGNNNQYFFFNFNPGIDSNLKMIAFTMKPDNEITDSSDRYNKYFDNPVSYLSKIGIASRIFEINSREFFKNKVLKYKIYYTKFKNIERWDYDYSYYKSRLHFNEIYYGDKKRIIKGDGFKESLDKLYDEIIELFFMTIKENKFQNLDVIFKEFQTISVNVYKINGESYTRNFDLFSDFADYFKKITNSIQDKNKLLNLFEKVLNSNINLNYTTKRALMEILKNEGVDILKLSQNIKSKKDQELNPMEFGMLSKRGENLKPIIQNKLSAIRRGEDVSFNSSEINYAIDNGFENIIKKYYQDSIPWYYENQLSFEDLQIYKKLNLYPAIEKAIVYKGKNYGKDSLNSIETSVYDYAAK